MSDTDYKRIYKFPVGLGSEYLVELRDGNKIYGADAGYIEADWFMEYGESWTNRELVDTPIDYNFQTGWGNGGPRMDYEYWGEAEELNPIWDDEGNLKEGWELIDDWAEVVEFAKSRPGLFEHLKKELCAGCEWDRNNQSFLGVRPHICGKEKSE